MKKVIDIQCPNCGEGPFVWDPKIEDYVCYVCRELIESESEDDDDDSSERDYDTEEWQAFEEGERPDEW